MSSISKQRIVVRRFKYLANHFIYNKPHKCRSSRFSIKPLHPSQIRKDRNFIRLGGIISGPAESLQLNFSPSFKKLNRLFAGKSPNGNNDNNNKNDSDQKQQRDLEVKKLQNLRQRSIDHIYDQESVWKAMKERDELLRRDRNDKDREEEKPDKDESK